MRNRSLSCVWLGLIATLIVNCSPQLVRAQLATGFESPFSPGTINGQQGWGTSTSTGSAAALTISTANPAAGGGTQHLRIVDNPSVADGSLTGAFSPATGFTGTTATVSSVDMFISGLGGANYGVILQAPSQSLLTARVEFDFQGGIFVADNTGSGLAFIDTGVDWVPGVYRNLTVRVNKAANTITYDYGGVQIYSGVAGVFGGTTVEQVVLYSDNFQNLGEFGDYDNLSITAAPVPEPTGIIAATAGVLGLLSMYRRKKLVASE